MQGRQFLRDARWTRVPRASLSSVPRTCTRTEAPVQALSTMFGWGHKQQGQLLKQLKCSFVGALVDRVLHMRFSSWAASWTMLLHDISDTGDKMQSQKASSTPPPDYSCRSWVPRGKRTLLTRRQFFFLSQASLTDSVSKVSEYDEDYWHSLYYLQLQNVTTQYFFLCSPFLAAVFD